MPYVIVQAEGDFEPIASWWIKETPEAQEKQWEDLCQWLVQEAGRREQSSETPLYDVFLGFDEEEFPHRIQQSVLKGILDQARKRIWGARLFFVVERLKLSNELVSIQESLGDWMKVLLEEGVTDLLQVLESFASENPEPLQRSLSRVARQTRDRRQVLNDIADHREWRCAFLTEQYEGRDLVGRLLQPLVIADPSHRADSNLVLVVTEEMPSAEMLKTHTEDPLHRVCLFATVNRDRSDSLKLFCESQRLPPPLVFHGELELWYFLLRLNELRKWYPSSFRVPESIHAVQARPASILRPAPQYPSLLFTGAFSSGEGEVDQWLTAAEEVGRLLRKVPHALESRIELAIQPERVVRALAAEPNVWIHMGHGSARSGLHIPGMDVTQEQWVDCFSQCDLRLALFLTCDSHEIARLFAECGAGVAIGFEGKVESDKTWHLAEKVLEVMFSRGTSRQVILEGFYAGARRFLGVQTLNATPRAYYPRGRR